MIVKNQQEALCVACEMERRAIGIYQRALTLTDKPEVRAGIQDILDDEREHLRRFSQVREQYCPCGDAEERLLIAAMGAEALFPGGVMEMRRANGLDSLKNLYTFARDSEADAVRTYGEFADKCEHPAAREAFLAIAREEGYRGVSTICQDNNLNAALFYLDVGFDIGGLDTRVYDGTKQEGKRDLFLYRTL